MQKDIHPDYHEVTVVMTNGEKFKTRSTYSGDKITLDVDPTTHPAWIGGTRFVDENVDKIAKFKERFGGVGLKKASAKQDAAPAPAESSDKS